MQSPEYMTVRYVSAQLQIQYEHFFTFQLRWWWLGLENIMVRLKISVLFALVTDRAMEVRLLMKNMTRNVCSF